MFTTLFKLMTRRALLIMVVDVTDEDEIQRHITQLEHIRDNVVPTAEEEKHKRRFANFGKPFDPELTLKNGDGGIKSFSRADNPKFFDLLDYLHNNPQAEYMSVRKLGDAVGVSKTLADAAKQFWSIEANQEMFTAFREQEQAGTPF